MAAQLGWGHDMGAPCLLPLSCATETRAVRLSRPAHAASPDSSTVTNGRPCCSNSFFSCSRIRGLPCNQIEQAGAGKRGVVGSEGQ